YLDKTLKRRSWPASMVGRIVKSHSDVHTYHERLEAATDADAVMALATWASEKKFKEEVLKRLHLRALEMDPDHEGANLELGRVRYQGEWMTPEGRDLRMKEEQEAAQRAKGLVRWKDQWVTPQDKARLEQGLVKYDDKWMSPDEIKRAQGFVKHKGKWVKKADLEVLKLIGPAREETGLGEGLRYLQTPNFIVMGDLTEAQLKVIADSMERFFAEWQRLFPEARTSGILDGKHRLFAFKKNRPYQRLVRARYQRMKETEEWSPAFAKQEQKRMKLRLRETSFWDVQPRVVSAHVQMPDPFEALKSKCVHFGGNVLATRQTRMGWPTWWLNEGLAYFFEKRVTGVIQTYNVDVGGSAYADIDPEDHNKARPWLDSTKWPEMLLHLLRTGRDPKLEKIKGKVLYGTKNRMTAQDVAKAWSVVTFLILDNPKKFAAFFRDAKEMGGGTPIEREAAAMLKHYGSYSKVEERWRKFALNGYRIAR
ncbi:MAG: hypothetical protein ACYSX0_18680, partial [Planctomycetota bacterium]